MPGERIAVEWSARFRRDVTELRKRDEARSGGAAGMLLRGLERLSDLIVGDAEHCFDNGYALVKDLTGTRRCKLGRRGRLFYIASHEKRMAIILYFGDTRRAGDPQNDAYAVFRRLLRSSEFDRLFEKIGATKPQV